MTTEQIRQNHQAAPFHPFTIHLADGRLFEVPHPEFLWIHPGGRLIWVAVNSGAAEVIDLRLVTSLTTHNGTQPG
jgi:hypothetical protein